MPPEARLDFPLEPIVQHIVQENIREHRADHPPLRRPRVRVRDAPVLEDARVEPLADQSSQNSIPYPTLEKIPQMAVVDRIEEFTNVHVHDPAAPRRRRPLPEALQRLMRRPSGSEA